MVQHHGRGHAAAPSCQGRPPPTPLAGRCAAASSYLPDYDAARGDGGDHGTVVPGGAHRPRRWLAGAPPPHPIYQVTTPRGEMVTNREEIDSRERKDVEREGSAGAPPAVGGVANPGAAGMIEKERERRVVIFLCVEMGAARYLLGGLVDGREAEVDQSRRLEVMWSLGGPINDFGETWPVR